MISDTFKNVRVIEELSPNHVIQYHAINDSFENIDVLEIIPRNESEKSCLDGIFTTVIPLLRNSMIEGIQNLVDYEISENRSSYKIYYDNLDTSYKPVQIFNKHQLIYLFDTMNYLARFNICAICIHKDTIYSSQNSSLKLKYVGLYNILKKFNLFEKDNLNYDEDVFYNDLNSIISLSKEFLVQSNIGDKIIDKCKYKQYSNYNEIANDVKYIPSNFRDTVKVDITRKLKEKYEDLLIEMNSECYIEISKKEDNDELLGKFATNKYSGKFAINDYSIFIFFILEKQGINKNNKYKININFDLNCSSSIHIYDYFFEIYNKTNNKNESKRNEDRLIDRWKTIPQLHKKYYTTNVLEIKGKLLNNNGHNKGTLISPIINIQNIGESLDTQKIKKFQEKDKNLEYGEKSIGKIVNFDPNSEIITFVDPKILNESIDNEAELVINENIISEIHQYDKEIKACEDFSNRNIVNPIMARAFLNPKQYLLKKISTIDKYYNSSIKLINSKINDDDSQKFAVINTLRNKPVYILQGPPGTGKTTVIVEVIEQLLKSNPNTRILVASQTNVAIDNVLEGLEKSPNNISFMRFVSKFSVDKLSDNIRNHTLESKLYNWQEKTINKSINYLEKTIGVNAIEIIELYKKFINNKHENDAIRVKKFNNHINSGRYYNLKYHFKNLQNIDDIETVFNKLLSNKNKKMIQYNSEWIYYIRNTTNKNKSAKIMKNNQLMGFEEAILNSTNVFGATNIHSAKRSYKEMGIVYYDYLIMDEASKSSPPQSMVPAKMVKNVLLIGDHKQLPPFKRKDILDEDMGIEAEKEFDESLFEFMINNFKDTDNKSTLSSMLNVQYRMPRHIGSLISKHFYEDKLNNPDVTKDIFKNYDLDKKHFLKLKNKNVKINNIEVPTSILFISTSNIDKRNDDGVKVKRTNIYNVSKVKRILSDLNNLKSTDNQSSDSPDNIGIIAAYRGQVGLLNTQIDLNDYDKFRDRNPNNIIKSLIKIDTVDAFQGMERDIIIFDIVRSSECISKIGFLDDNRRLNVAFSRARKLLIIVGDHEFILNKAINNKNDNNDFKLREIVEELQNDNLIYYNLSEALDE